MSGSDYWPEGEAYKTPLEEPQPIPICTSCGSRHREPAPWCRRDNTGAENDGRRT